MTTSSTTSSSNASTGSSASKGATQGGDVNTTGGDSELQTSQGQTSIADSVVSKIAGVAAREVNGVHRMGAGAARAFGALKERLPGSNSNTNVTQGVVVEVGERQAAIDIDVVVEYGVSITDLASSIRRNVISAVEGMTGLQVTEVNISVDDVHLPGDDDDSDRDEDRQRSSEPERARVQ